MIQSKEDYKYYLEADRLSLGIGWKNPRIFGDYYWKYQRLLRKVEYFKNCKRHFIYKPFYYWLYYWFRKLSIKYGFEISANQLGPGLSLVHAGTVVIHPKAIIGKNCRIHAGVNIGGQPGGTPDEVPTIGDNVYIGPGAKLFGKIIIANGIAIGANSVVNKSFSEENISIAGVPAKKISNKGSELLMIRGAK